MDEKPVGDLRVTSTLRFSPEYKTKVFQVWYSAGKPTAADLRNILPVPETNFGSKPSVQTLSQWMYGDFQERAKELDAGVRKAMDSALVATKVEMLKQHIVVAKKMQDIAIEYLENNKDDLSAPAAVRLLVEGIRIERESVGIPGMLDKMRNKTDEELLEEVKKLVEEAPVEFQTIEDENEYDNDTDN